MPRYCVVFEVYSCQWASFVPRRGQCARTRTITVNLLSFLLYTFSLCILLQLMRQYRGVWPLRWIITWSYTAEINVRYICHLYTYGNYTVESVIPHKCRFETTWIYIRIWPNKPKIIILNTLLLSSSVCKLQSDTDFQIQFYESYSVFYFLVV